MEITRQYLEKCTIGRITHDNSFICYSLERPWLNNEKNISCVPAGVYDLQRYDSARFKDCFSLTCFNLGVGLTENFQRTYILIHAANRVSDLHGCIAPGLGISGYLDEWVTVDSRKALDKLRTLIHNENIQQMEIV